MDENKAADCCVYGCVNQKGGAGKSASSANIGIELAWRVSGKSTMR